MASSPIFPELTGWASRPWLGTPASALLGPPASLTLPGVGWASQVPGMAGLGATRESSLPPQAPCTHLPPPGPGAQGEGTGGAAFAHLPWHVVSSFGSDAVPAGLATGTAGAACGWGSEQLVMGLLRAAGSCPRCWRSDTPSPNPQACPGAFTQGDGLGQPRCPAAWPGPGSRCCVLSLGSPFDLPESRSGFCTPMPAHGPP